MRTVKLEPVTRVEGHGRVELEIAGGRVRGARVAITESPRLLEALLLGRSYTEVPALICRICAICSTVHRVAACQAIENALGVEIPPRAAVIRELAVLGGHLESHCLHLFCLVLPDLEGSESVLELLGRESPVAGEGLALKDLGNRLQEFAGGRVIHPVNIEVGGVLQEPDPVQAKSLLEELKGWPARLAELAAPFTDAEGFPPSKEALGLRVAVRPPPGEFSLSGQALAISDGRAVPGSRYREILQEYSVDYSRARHSRFGREALLTGALARLELCPEGRAWRDRLAGGAAGIHGNNTAQFAELGWAVERARRLLDILLNEERGELRVPVAAAPGVGTAVIEAPRGLLVHHYALDDMGRVAAADIVTPTAVNQVAMEEQLLADLAPVAGEGEIRRVASRIVRAYDPCISCSVHLIRG